MAISSIHIESGRGGYFYHNSREQETLNSIFHDEENYCSRNAKASFAFLSKELKPRIEAYEKRTKQKFQKRTITHLSAIVNFNKEHTEKDMQKVCEYLEETLDTKVVQLVMHRDEGHEFEGNIIKNYHAHIEFVGIDKKGNSIRRKLDKPFLKQLQTDIAELLGMERGQESGYTKEQYKEIISKLRPVAEYESKKEYNKAFNEVAKGLNYVKELKKANKRLDTYEYKNFAKLASEARNAEVQKVKAKQKDLKALNNESRAKLSELELEKEEKAKRFRELEALNRELKQRIKSKVLLLEDLEFAFDEFKLQAIQENGELKQKIAEQNDTIQELKSQVYHPTMIYEDKTKATYKAVAEHFEKKYDKEVAKNSQLRQEIEDLKEKLNKAQKQSNSYLGLNRDLKDEIIGLKTQINSLESRINDLGHETTFERERSASHPNMEDFLSVITENTDLKEEIEILKQNQEKKLSRTKFEKPLEQEEFKSSHFLKR